MIRIARIGDVEIYGEGKRAPFVTGFNLSLPNIGKGEGRVGGHICCWIESLFTSVIQNDGAPNGFPALANS